MTRFRLNLSREPPLNVKGGYLVYYVVEVKATRAKKNFVLGCWAAGQAMMEFLRVCGFWMHTAVVAFFSHSMPFFSTLFLVSPMMSLLLGNEREGCALVRLQPPRS